MEVIEVRMEQYKKEIPVKYIYNSVEFNELNKYKVSEVKYLIFEDTKIRYGMIAGMTNEKELICPFSAPFGEFVSVKEGYDVECMHNAIEALDIYVRENGIKYIKIVCPPMFYDESGITVIMNALLQNDYCVKYMDINFQLKLSKVYTDNYINLIPRNARWNLRTSLKKGLNFVECTSIDDKKRAYEVIKKNRESKGYPLRMTWEQVEDTIKIVDNDFFVINYEGVDIAAAQIFKVTDKIVQVVYWGDVPGYSEVKPINYLAYMLIDYYGKIGYEYIDIGPSTEEGQPNFGLCNFKNSIGCDTSSKFTLEKVIKR